MMPNPNNGTFVLKGDLGNTASKIAEIEVADMLGKTVYKSSASIVDGVIIKNISLSEQLANGTYLVRIKYDKQSQVVKFTLNK